MDDRDGPIGALLERLAPEVDEDAAWEALSQRIVRGRRRRGALVGAAACAVAALGLAGVLVAVDDDRATVEVGTAPTTPVVDAPTTASAPAPDVASTTAPPSTSPTPSVTAGEWIQHALVATPARDLDDGQRVLLAMDPDPGGEVVARLCTSEAIGAANPSPWCDPTHVSLRSPAGRPDLAIEVARVIATDQLGLVDCAAAVGRCAVVVWTTQDTSRATAYAAPIAFRTELPPIPVPALAMSDSTVTDGDAVTVTLSGFRPGEDVVVGQCPVAAAGATDASISDTTITCDMGRIRHVVPAADGTVTMRWIVGREVLTYDGWVPCDPCSLTASSIRVGRVAVDLVVLDDGAPTRPAVRIVEPGPHAAGAVVTIEGTGFQAGPIDFEIGWCNLGSSIDRDCAYPQEGFGIAVGDDGTFSHRFPLPDDRWAATSECVGTGSTCVLSWYPGEGSPPAFATPFAVTG
jgi:hypothetical protein